jgi:hypothetical protein
MDIFSHGLWAVLGLRYLNLKRKIPKFSGFKVFFWGMFPDLFAFTIPFVYMIWNWLFNGIAMMTKPDIEPIVDHGSIIQLTGALYNISHSLIIFAIVSLIAYFIFRKKAIILGAWLMHIIMDVPTHSYQFYPTPILWPLSSWKVNGFSWANPYFLLADYLLIIIIYLFVIRRLENKKKR